MNPRRVPWYARWKPRFGSRPEGTPGVGIGQERADYAGGGMLESTELAYQYLLQSQRINAPGYADQNYFEMSKSGYTGIPYLTIHCFASQASLASVKLFEYDEDGEKLPLSEMEEAAQLFQNPNPDDSCGDLLEQIALQFKLTGTALLWAPHDAADPYDRPEELYVLSTASALPQPISPRYPNGAYLIQPWYPAGPYGMIPVTQGVGATVPAEQIIRIKEPHPFFRWIGYATLAAISLQTDTAKMIDLARMNHMRKGPDPNFMLTWDASIKQPTEADLRRLEAQLQAVFNGPENAGRTFFTPAGARLEKISNAPADMAYQEGWAQLMGFGISAFNMNKGALGMTDGLTYATLFASLKQVYLFGLRPFFNKVAQGLTRQLLQPHFNRRFTAEIEGEEIQDDDTIDKRANTLCQHGLVKVGEVRKWYGLPPSERDDEWVEKPGNQDGMRGQHGSPAGTKVTDPHQLQMEQHRPDVPNPGGMSGGGKSYGERQERLLAALEKAKTNGYAQPVEK